MTRGFIVGDLWTAPEIASLEWMWKRGLDIDRICRRLGRSKKSIWEFVRKKGWLRGDSLDRRPRRDPARKRRTCLSCGELFASEGPGNRICRSCKDEPGRDEEIDMPVGSEVSHICRLQPL